MKLICLTKPVPDVEEFRYDYERNVLVRDEVRQVLNPEDISALAFALDVKEAFPETTIETVSMAPLGAVPHLEDLIRRGVDRATLISDSRYVGSDTYVTSRILGRYLEGRPFDWIVSGTHSLDGGTAHVPSQIGEILGIPQMSNVIEIDRDGLNTGSTVVDVDTDDAVFRFTVDAPALLSLQYSTRLKLPYIAYEKIELDVRDQIDIIDNERLEFDESEVGLEGSLTRVVEVEAHRLERKDTRFVRCDDTGIEAVYGFLREKGFVS
jgi:electron transfer flavoprotein beta subunit